VRAAGGNQNFVTDELPSTNLWSPSLGFQSNKSQHEVGRTTVRQCARR
jgi:hypothetical protein